MAEVGARAVAHLRGDRGRGCGDAPLHLGQKALPIEEVGVGEAARRGWGVRSIQLDEGTQKRRGIGGSRGECGAGGHGAILPEFEQMFE